MMKKTILSMAMGVLTLALLVGTPPVRAAADTVAPPTVASAATATNPVTAPTGTGNDTLLKPADPYSIQGQSCPTPVDGNQHVDAFRSTWSCPGNSNNMMQLNYTGGEKYCVYIDNANAGGGPTYFVPMSTLHEWIEFLNHRPAPVSIRYGCPGKMLQDPCDSKVLHKQDDSANQTLATFSAAAGRSYTYQCQASGAGCGNWVLISDTGACHEPINGACGVASGVSTPTAPASDLCSVGTPSGVMGSGPWNWTCAGDYAGSTATCGAAKLTPTDLDLTFALKACVKKYVPVDIALVLDASSSMSSLIKSAKTAMTTIVGELNGKDVRLAVTAFGGSGYTKVAGSSSCPYGVAYTLGALDAAAVNTAIGKIGSSHNTPMAAGITYATSLLTPTDQRRAAMIVLSDGVANCSTGNVNPQVKAANTKGIETFGIAYGNATMSNFSSFQQSRKATASSEIFDALDTYISQATSVECTSQIAIYAPGDRTTPLQTAKNGDHISLPPGTYDFVINYCDKTETLPGQIVGTATRTLSYEYGCAH